jgi:hypothetical protein
MKRTTSEETTKQWMVYLYDLKYQLENFNIRNRAKIASKHRVDTKLGQFLAKSKIIYKDDFGYYKWNEKIPVSIKIINAHRLDQYRRNTNKDFAKKHSNTNKLIQQKIDFNKETKKETNYNTKDWLTINSAKEVYSKSESTIRAISRGLRKNKSKQIKLSTNENGREIILLNKNYLDSIFKKAPIQIEQEIDVTKLKLYAPKQANNIGLIRKFLKWIY